MRREQRLTGSQRFYAVRREGQGWANRLLVLKAIPNNSDINQFGLVVGKRLGGAVARNRVKRRLREAIRQTPLKSGWDVVLIARRGAESVDYQRLTIATRDLLKRANLISDAAEHLTPCASGRTEPKPSAEEPREEKIVEELGSCLTPEGANG